MGQRIHLIAVGGAVMHQLAIFLHKQGNTVSGSDDVIFDPAKGQLEREGLLPDADGWHPERIHTGLDTVILGMHARAGNPELERALELGLPVYSFPQFIYHRSFDKKRVVIAGSHGKTSVTSMIMHILRDQRRDFDYMVGARIVGFDTMVRLSDAPVIILEGDEYLSSAIDPRSKFLHYHPDIAVITGIAWDHINVFPEFEQYLDTFRQFIAGISPDGQLYCYRHDRHLPGMAANAPCASEVYEAYESRETETGTVIEWNGGSYPVQVFGRHNMENIRAAVRVCTSLGIAETDALTALRSFQGSARRLEAVSIDDDRHRYVYRDFAHAPSKLKASNAALRGKYPDQKLVTVFELHTYSSLQTDFLEHYRDSLRDSDEAAVFLDAEALAVKGRPDIPDSVIREAFGLPGLPVLRTAGHLAAFLAGQPEENVVLALMSSGHFGGFEVKDLIDS